MREATLTVSPIAVYSSRRAGEPMSPTTATPVCRPMPMRSGASPRAARSLLRRASSSSIASAQSSAWTA